MRNKILKNYQKYKYNFQESYLKLIFLLELFKIDYGSCSI